MSKANKKTSTGKSKPLGLLANEAKQRKEYAKAEEMFRILLKEHTNNVDVLSSLAQVLIEQKKINEAEEFLEQIFQQDKASPLTYHLQGLCKQLAGDLKQAEDMYQKALDLDPDYSPALNNMSSIFATNQEFEKAERYLERLLKTSPDQAQALANLGTIKLEIGQVEKGISLMEKALKITPDSNTIHSNILLDLQYTERAPSEIYQEHIRWQEMHGCKNPKTASDFDVEFDPTRKLRIAYISPDFVLHSVSYFMVAILKSHDPNNVEVFCYHDNPKEDEMTQHLKTLCPNWRSIHHLEDAQLSDAIQKDKIDILIELSGHTANNRMLMLSERVAPIQISYLGYPGTTGLKAMDYKITDYWCDQEGKTEQFYSESLVRMKNGFLCYQPPSNIEEPTSIPFDKNGYITFGCFNVLQKISNKTMDYWCETLHRVPNSRFLLKGRALGHTEAQKIILQRFSDRGINKERISLLPPTSGYHEHLKLYSDMDIALDTTPYNGTTTTCEALWMGVPVLTLEGDSHVSRVGYSIMQQASLPELVTETESELVDRIVEIAQQPELLRHLRKNIRKHVQFSNLTNAAEFTRELESLYRQCWKKLSAEMKNSNIIQSRSHHFSLSDQYLSVSDGSTKIQFPIDKVDVNIGGIIESGQWCPPDFKMIENLLSSAEKVIDFLPTSPTFFYSFIHILKGKDHTNLIDTKHYLGEIRHFPINTLDIGAGDTESTLAKADFIHSYHFSDAFELMNTLQNSKPIIVISPENMLELDSPLPDACASHGYQIFRYLPLIDQLVEISPQSLKGASSRLSAVCIPKERVNALVENKVILQDSNRPPVSEQLPNWVEQMKKMDYARNFVDEWQTEARRNPATNQHMKAIQHYLASMESENKEDCYDHLLNAFHLILPMLKSAPGISNLLTAARITSTLSLSDSTLDILEMVLQILREDENLNLSEAFLPPSSEFDHINPEDNFAGWIMACVTECREHHRTQSFLNSSEEDISQLTTHCQSSFASEFSKKRLFLLKKFFSDISSPYETTEIDTSPASDEKYYSIYDYILICAPSSIDYMTSYVFMEQRDWFEDEIRFVRKLIQPGMNIIDIGANYGAYTLSIADKLKGQGHIWAFEPTKKTHDCLQKSIHKNQYSNITLIRTGLSDHKGTATFYTSPNSELNSLSRIEGISGSEETISLTTLDDFFHENHLPQIDFIKLDAEGEEIRILQKSKQFLEKNSPLIMYELKHGSNINTPLIKELAKHGYKSYRLIPGTETLIPFDHTQSFDGYLLNLFACKDDRSINLIKNEHLILDMPNEIIPDKDVLMNYLCQLSIILGKKTTTQLTNNSHPLYLDMLTHYLCSKDDKLNTKTRTAHLYHALRLSQGILNSGDESAEVLISASRIAIDLGDRTGGVNLLQKVINRIEILLKTDIKQLPLPANENFEKMHSNGQLKEWLISSAIDQLIRKHAFSTYFTGKQSIQLFKKLENLGFNNEDMKIKFGLLKKRLQLS